MPGSGGGTITITPGVSGTTVPTRGGACLSLARYAAKFNISECAIWGVRRDVLNGACDSIWTLHMRTTLLEYLAQAQDMIEDQIRYPLCPRWINETDRPYSPCMHTEWGWVIEPGVMATTTVLDDAVVSHAVDPATITAPTTVTDPAEIHVFYPDTDTEIIPDSVTITGGVVTIRIPRCRMVDIDLIDNPVGGLTYTDLANFQGTVDIRRVYNDTSTQAVLVWPSGKANCNGCTAETASGCIAVKTYKTGSVHVLSASYAGGSWSSSSLCADWGCSALPRTVQLNYKAGLTVMPLNAEDAVIRLAHSLMPEQPCGCDIAIQHWKRDRYVPDFISPDRERCVFGYSDGALFAWKQKRALRLIRPGIL